MELRQDWKSFRTIFYPQRRSFASGPDQRDVLSPVSVITDQGKVLTAYADGEDLSDWSGKSIEEAKSMAHGREWIEIERAKAEEWLEGALTIPNYQDQLEYWKSECRKSYPKAIRARPHFLLEGLNGWWSKVLPSTYGVYLRLEPEVGTSGPVTDLLMVVRRGRFEGWIDPDFSTMHASRRLQPAEVIRYLSERYVVPVQGIYVPALEWQKWSRMQNPWRDVARSVRQNQTRLVPFRWSLAAMVTTRGFFGV